MENSITGYPFVDHVDQTARPVINNAKQYLNNAFVNGYSAVTDIQRSGRVRIAGYVFDFSPLLRTFLYKQYGSWHEAKAPNKTTLRKSIYGKIDRIVEI